MAALSNSAFALCTSRPIRGAYAGSNWHPYTERVRDAASWVDGTARLMQPTVGQSAAVFRVEAQAITRELRRRGWYRRARGQKRRVNGAWQLALRELAFTHGIDALVDELAAMGAPAQPANGAALNGASQHAHT